MRSVVTVHGERPYDVVIGPGAGADTVRLLGPAARQVAVLHAPAVRDLALQIAAQASEAGHAPLLVELPDGEAAKSDRVAADCWETLGRAGFTRSDAVVGVGGGATTDVSGFVAATWLRGIDHVAVPTTLLGMVDAAVGGKTGINTAAGKNLVGAFHAPLAVVCDLDVLATLPPRDYAAGMAEVVKCGLIRDTAILDRVSPDPAACGVPGNPHEAELVRRAVQVKADVVGVDLRESTTPSVGSGAGLPPVTGREVLNYGHTLGHAIEHVEGYRWRHGDAISVGMVFVAEVAEASGLLGADDVALHRHLLGGLGLPITYAAGQWDGLAAAMRLDKKSRGSLLRLVALAGIADPVLLAGPDERVLQEAYRRVSA